MKKRTAVTIKRRTTRKPANAKRTSGKMEKSKSANVEPICQACVWEKSTGFKGNQTHTCPASQETPKTVDHPPHYNKHPSGIECITIVEHMTFNIGNAVKYLWRSEHKSGIEDLKKAVWYIQREIQRLEKQPKALNAVIVGFLAMFAGLLIRSVLKNAGVAI